MRRPWTLLAVAAAAAIAVTTTAALASEHGERHHDRDREERRERRTRAAAPGADPEARALYRKECGACHLDFPPGLLPAESHRRVMAGLERHFGQDAELEPEVRGRLERWLVENAAEAGTARESGEVLASLRGAPPVRVTEVPWFQREHRKAAAKLASRPSIRTLADCAACHGGAGDWDFDEDRVRMPAR